MEELEGGPDPGGQRRVGRGLPMPPCLPARRVSAWVMAQGGPIPAAPRDPTCSHHQPHRQRAQGSGTCRAKGLQTPWPHSGRVLTCTRTPTPPSPASAHPGASAGSSPRQGWGGWGGGGGPGTVAPEPVTLRGGGAGMRDGGTGTAPHPVYKRWREETRSQGHVRQQLPRNQALLPAGTRVPYTPLRQLA